MGKRLSRHLHHSRFLWQCHESDAGMESGRLHECTNGHTKPDIAIDAERNHCP